MESYFTKTLFFKITILLVLLALTTGCGAAGTTKLALGPAAAFPQGLAGIELEEGEEPQAHRWPSDLEFSQANICMGAEYDGRKDLHGLSLVMNCEWFENGNIKRVKFSLNADLADATTPLKAKLKGQKEIVGELGNSARKGFAPVP